MEPLANLFHARCPPENDKALFIGAIRDLCFTQAGVDERNCDFSPTESETRSTSGWWTMREASGAFLSR